MLDSKDLFGKGVSASKKGNEGTNAGKSRKTEPVDMAMKKTRPRKNETSSALKGDKMVKINHFSEENDEKPVDLISKPSLSNSPKDLVVRHKDPKERNKITVAHGSHEVNEFTVHGDSSSTESKHHPSIINDKTPTCHHSEIKNGVTLRGGIAREGVEDGGIVVDMNECIGQCCRNPSCNVAFMLKDNCFLLPCTDTQLCQVVDLPTKSLNTKLAFVSRDSTAKIELKMFDNIVKALGLSSTAKMSNSSLDSQIKKSEVPSRINATNTDAPEQVAGGGDSEKPLNPSSNDNSNNATVQELLDETGLLTSATDFGQALKSASEKGSFKPSDPKPKPYAQPNRNSPSLPKLPLKPKLCPYSKVEYNTTIKGGMAAADYKYGGKVTNINDCVEMCCESDSCNIAFMFSNECFLLVCKYGNQCESIPAASTELNLRMVRLLKTNSGKDNQRLEAPDEVLKVALNPKKDASWSTKETIEDGNHKENSISTCMKSDPVLHVVPEGGMKPGHYKDFGRVKSVRECVEFCCGWPKCSMAFMVLDGCFGVSCQDHCHVVASKDLSFQSKVVYVKRRQDVLHWLNSQGSSRSTVLGVANLTDKKGESMSNVDAVGGSQSIRLGNRTQKVIKPMATNSQPAKSSITPTHFHIKEVSFSLPTDAEKPETLRHSKSHINNMNQAASDNISVPQQSSLPTNISEESTISKDKRGDGIKPQINVKAAVEPKMSSRDENKGICISGEVEHDVTLGGGIKAGSYTEQGEVLDMHECVEWCCKEKRCDVAMVIKGICYTVSCYDQEKCVSVPVRRIQYHPALVHVRRRKRGMAHDGYYSTNKGNDVSLQEIVDGSGRTSRIDHALSDEESENQENKKSAIEDELVDLLTEQALRGHDMSQIQKGKIRGHVIAIVINNELNFRQNYSFVIKCLFSGSCANHRNCKKMSLASFSDNMSTKL